MSEPVAIWHPLRSHGRYAVLWHDGSQRGDHYDWLFEGDSSLATWALQQSLPSDIPGWQLAERLPDHRMLYLDYEGPISGGRGSVRRVEQGDYRLVEMTADVCCLQLTGRGAEQQRQPPGGTHDCGSDGPRRGRLRIERADTMVQRAGAITQRAGASAGQGISWWSFAFQPQIDRSSLR